MTSRRAMLGQYFADNPRFLALMEQTIDNAEKASASVSANVDATTSMDQATVLTLSPNTAFGNEYVLSLGTGLVGIVGTNSYVLELADTVPSVDGGFNLAFTVAGPTSIALPVSGQMATTSNPETLQRKTLDAPSLSGLVNAANDAAAATAGVPIGGVYRDGSNLKVRV